jgi:predicted ArsR family transcriptional regulator
MHSNQKKILELSKTEDLTKLSYREIGKKLGIEYPQVVKYHIEQLTKKGF